MEWLLWYYQPIRDNGLPDRQSKDRSLHYRIEHQCDHIIEII